MLKYRALYKKMMDDLKDARLGQGITRFIP